MTTQNPLLIHENCLDALTSLPESSVDLVLADPPYGTTQCKWDSIIPLEPLWEQLKRVIKPRGAIVMMAAEPFTSILVTSNLKMFKYDIVWEKGNATGFLNAKKMPLRAHEKAVVFSSSDDDTRTHEDMLVFYNKLPAFEPQMTHGHERKTASRKTVNSECYGKAITVTKYDSTSRYPRSVQFFSSDKQKENLHPTQKPVALMEWLINSYCPPNGVVLDFCMGSGTTGIAALNTDRRFIGIELDESHYNTAYERINKVTKERVGN
ncbi:site-specific DNA-methyltransferase [Vibrio parahaemolyticus]|nr:site-specific DNA-methyltransferase [Vibrio parahaemolyticus]